MRGADIGTEAATAVVMHLVKSAVYRAANVTGPRIVGIGLLLGLVLLLGAYIGKRIVDRTPERAFVILVELALIAAGIRLLWTA